MQDQSNPACAARAVLVSLLLAATSLGAVACSDDNPNDDASASGSATGAGGGGGTGGDAGTGGQGTGGEITAAEVEAYCTNLENCWDDAAPCSSLYQDFNAEACHAEARALVDCVLDNGPLNVCEGEDTPCLEEFDAYYGCQP
jgi:hypothetical protein